jgi:ABC-type Fe3+/spermidine/putrescine transport system ATPase subunit
MRDGRVLQLGPPRELYERPRTRFVADFVGTNNLVPGTVVETANGTITVDTGLGRLRARPPAGGESLPVGRNAVLAIRPENVAIDVAGAGPTAGDGNRCSGRIQLAAYLGNTLRYDVEAAGGLTLKADVRDAWHHEPLPRGTPVTLGFPPSVTLALPDDDPPRTAGARPDVGPG